MDKQYAKVASYDAVADEEDGDIDCSSFFESSEGYAKRAAIPTTEIKVGTYSSKEDVIHNLAASRLNLNLDNSRDRKINNIIKKAINDIKKL